MSSIIDYLKHFVADLDTTTNTYVTTQNEVTYGNIYFNESFNLKFAYTQSESLPALEESNDNLRTPRIEC